jgi:hypothetical protein
MLVEYSEGIESSRGDGILDSQLLGGLATKTSPSIPREWYEEHVITVI